MCAMSGDSVCLAIIGDGAVGKSSLINAFKSSGFARAYKQTVGIEFYEKTLQLRSGAVSASLKVWDIGGQSLNSKNLQSYLATSRIIFMVYDITSIESFNNLNDWLSNVKKYCSNTYNNIHIYIVGNKIDLVGLRQVPADEHDTFISSNALKGGLFMSAKTGENVVRAFYAIAGEALGIRLSAYELSFYDKVLTAHVQKESGEDEERTAFADDIEREDRRLEKIKKQGGVGCSRGGCMIS